MAKAVALMFLVVVLSTATISTRAEAQQALNMGFSGAGIGSDLLKVIDRAGLW